eukprot:1193235-Rhodomonas_salina.1
MDNNTRIRVVKPCTVRPPISISTLGFTPRITLKYKSLICTLPPELQSTTGPPPRIGRSWTKVPGTKGRSGTKVWYQICYKGSDSSL